jgi:Tfp pilus assembly protein PilV
MRASLPPPTAGFALLEVLVATGLAGFIAMGIAMSLSMSISVSGASQEVTELTAAAVDRLEEFNSLRFEDAALDAGGSLTTSDTGFSEDPLGADPNRFVRWQIEDVSFNLKRITVAVGSRSSNIGDQREVRFETFKVLTQ